MILDYINVKQLQQWFTKMSAVWPAVTHSPGAQRVLNAALDTTGMFTLEKWLDHILYSTYLK